MIKEHALSSVISMPAHKVNDVLLLSRIAGKKFGVDMSNKILTNEAGAEVESADVLRDNDKLFVVDVEELVQLAQKC